MGTTILYLGIIVLLPLAALLLKATEIGPAQAIAILSTPRTLSAIRVTLLTALGATAINAIYGLALAWVLVRYEFPGKRLLDALVDVPFALPTAVAGLTLTALFAENGWFGGALKSLGITIVYTPLGIILAMTFTSLPFIVRLLQPVIAELSAESEEAARTLGATDGYILRTVILPALVPSLLAGCSLAFARCIGEFGAVIFIAGNNPQRTEVMALLTFIRLEEFDYPAAAVLAVTMMAFAFVMLLCANGFQKWHLRYLETGR